MKFKSFFSLFIYTILAFSILSFSSCQKDDDTNGSGNTNDYTYLSATIDGQQYTGLKPLAYPLQGVAALINQTSGAKYLKLQGSDPDYGINIEISENNWGVLGTFPLDPRIFPTQDGYYGHVVFGLGQPTPDILFGTSGSITITKFDLTTKEFEATFNLEYYRDVSGGGQTGPFYVTDGTLDFPLDNEEFD